MKYHSRQFLNENEGLAAIECSVARYNEDMPYIDAAVTITDCYKAITLDFDMYGEEGAANNIQKLEILMEELARFKEALEKEYEKALAEKESEEEE